MPPVQRGHARKLPSGKWQLRYYEADGTRKTGGTFQSKSAAMQHYRDAIEPRLNGTEPVPELTLSELVELYLERHAAVVRPRTITTLRERLVHATRAYGDVPLRELERMAGELAAWQATLPERSRYGIVQALRQTLAAAVRWDYMSRNPAKLAGRNPEPPPRPIRAYTLAELDALAVELSQPYQPLPAFAAATGLRPEEWLALERRDIDRRAGIVNIGRTVSDGVIVELGKTSRSRRQVPLSRRASTALDALPPRLDTPLLFPAPGGGLLDLDNFRRREWGIAVTASGVAKPARIYDLRSSFASNALAAGVTVFELARVMGTSVRMIERHYGALLDGAHSVIASRLDAFEAEREQAATQAKGAEVACETGGDTQTGGGADAGVG
jgi:integrase